METALLVLTNALGGSTYPATAVMLRGFSPDDGLFLRMAVCSLLFAPTLWRARRRLRALAARKAWALGAGLAGSLLIAFQGLPRLGEAPSGRLAGDLLLAASGGCWALYTVIGKPALRRVDPLDYTAATTVLCFLAVCVWAGRGLSPSAWRAAGAGAWLSVLYLAVAGNFLGAWVWNVALRRVEASRQANFVFLQPLVGVALGVGLLGDALTGWTLAGGGLVLAGLWAVRGTSG